jgi:hypothetical protein
LTLSPQPETTNELKHFNAPVSQTGELPENAGKKGAVSGADVPRVVP